MASRFFFNGQVYFTPLTVSQVNDSGFGPNTLGLGNIVAYIGDSYGGMPNVKMTFNSPDEAQATLISGPLLTAVNKAFSPSAETGAPSQVIAMRAGAPGFGLPLQTALQLMNVNGSAVIDLQSTQYGLPAGITKVKIERGSNWVSTANSYKLSVAVGTNLQYQDNIYRQAFTTSYSGTQASATINVTGTSVVLCAPALTVVATIDLTVFTTIDTVVDQINGVPGFTAAIGLNSTGKVSTYGLDFNPAANDCKTQPYVTTATVQAMLDWFNSPDCGLVTATRVDGGSGAIPVLIPWTFLTNTAALVPPGGLVVNDYAYALAAMQTVECQWVIPLSGNPAVWAAADAHVQYMSTVARKERRCLVGPPVGTTVAAVEAMPLAINSDRTSICFPGYQDYDQNGNLVTLDSFYMAALIGACFAGLSPGDAMTNKAINVVGLEVIPGQPSGLGLLQNPTDTDPLIEAGVMCVEATPTGYKVVRSITTWLINDNFNRVEVSTGAAVDYMMRSVRDAVDQARGGRQGPQLLGLAISVCKSILTDLARPEPAGPGILVGDANSPAFGPVTGTITGDQLLLSFTASPVIPNNFIGVTVSLNAYSGTASA